MNNTSTEGKLLLKRAEEEPEIDLEAFSSLADIELTIFALVDRRTISVHELMHLKTGDVLPLSRPAGENIDVLVGDVLIGSAEILVTEDRLAVRMAELRDKPAVYNERRFIEDTEGR